MENYPMILMEMNTGQDKEMMEEFTHPETVQQVMEDTIMMEYIMTHQDHLLALQMEYTKIYKIKLL